MARTMSSCNIFYKATLYQGLKDAPFFFVVVQYFLPLKCELRRYMCKNSLQGLVMYLKDKDKALAQHAEGPGFGSQHWKKSRNTNKIITMLLNKLESTELPIGNNKSILITHKLKYYASNSNVEESSHIC